MKILMPLPAFDFDPSEVALMWLALSDAGHDVVFATPDGQAAYADPLMLTGEGLDAWSRIPGLRSVKLLGLFLRARRDARVAHAAMVLNASYQSPLSYEQAWECDQAEGFDGLFLAGGHARGMRTYLESERLQALVARFFLPLSDDIKCHRPVGAVCHGVLLAARSRDAVSGQSVLHGRRTTALTWQLEHSAWLLARLIGRFWDPDYYRTYTERAGEPHGFWSVEQEVRRALAHEADFVDVPRGWRSYKKRAGLWRDSPFNDAPAWVVEDGSYISARWPGDIHTLGQRFITLLANRRLSNAPVHPDHRPL